MSSIKKSVGAPPGNKNALKHGLYTSITAAPAAPNLEDISLISELNLLRSLLDSYVSDIDHLDISTLDTISAICLRISSIYKAHALVVGPNLDISSIISQSIQESFPNAKF